MVVRPTPSMAKVKAGSSALLLGMVMVAVRAPAFRGRYCTVNEVVAPGARVAEGRVVRVKSPASAPVICTRLAPPVMSISEPVVLVIEKKRVEWPRAELLVVLADMKLVKLSEVGVVLPLVMALPLPLTIRDAEKSWRCSRKSKRRACLERSRLLRPLAKAAPAGDRSV